MDIRLLRLFIAVYEEKNFTAASKRCFVSQPSISTAIRQLEEELGKNLFVRHKKGVTPTPDAEYLYPMAIRMLGDLERLPQVFQDKADKKKLTLGMMPDLSSYHVSAFLKFLNENISGLELEIVDFNKPTDVTLTIDVLKKEEDLFLPLWEEDYVICIPENHPLADKDIIHLEDLHEQNFIECPPCEAHQQTMGLLARSQRMLNIVANADYKIQVLYLILAGVGISFLPTGLIENVKGVVTRPYSGQRMFRRIGLAYSSSAKPCPALEEILGLSDLIHGEFNIQD